MIAPLSDVLRLSGMESGLISRARLGCPFGVHAGDASRGIFHLVAAGELCIRAHDDPLYRLGPGDLAVLPRGAAHDIVSSPHARITPIGSHPRETRHGLPTVHNHSDPALDLLCGSFQLGFPAHDWIVPPLPELLVVRNEGRLGRYLADTVSLLEHELSSGAPGSQLIIARLLEVLVIQALRTWATSHPDVARGWLVVVDAPALSAAFASLQAPPAEWSVEHMAQGACLSRSRFQRVFRERVGVPPGDWLVTWRVAVAQDTIRRGSDLQQAADRAGYSTQATFGRAFKRVTGQTPGHWRGAMLAR